VSWPIGDLRACLAVGASQHGNGSRHQAYPDWRLLSYAVRLPVSDEPALQRVVQLVEELVEQAVQGFSTLSLETLRWLRSPHAKDVDVRPFSRFQNKQSQLRAAQLWARLLCYCLRMVAVEQQTEQQAEQLESIARLFPWHGRQRRAAERLWKLLTSPDASSSESTVGQRTYVLRLWNGTKRPTLCTVPYTRYLYRYTPPSSNGFVDKVRTDHLSLTVVHRPCRTLLVA
jgi:hypothetical protein